MFEIYNWLLFPNCILKELGISYDLSIKVMRSDHDHGIFILQWWLVFCIRYNPLLYLITFFYSVFVNELNLCQMPCSVISILQNFSFQQTKGIWWFASIRYLYPTTLLKHLNTFPAEIGCNSIGKYETMINVTTNLVVTLRLIWP